MSEKSSAKHSVLITVAIIGAAATILAACVAGVFSLVGDVMSPAVPPANPPGTLATNPPTETQIVPATVESPTPATSHLEKILYIYYTDVVLASEYEEVLVSEGFTIEVIHMDQIAETDFSEFGLIVVGPDTIGSGENEMWYRAWGDEQSVAAIHDSGKPILGLGSGGYGVFARLNLRIGGGYGAQGFGNGTVRLTSYQTILQEPNPITEEEITLYTKTLETREIYLGSDVEEPLPQSAHVESIGSVSYELENGVRVEYGLVVLQSDRYLFWGFAAPPSYLTPEGIALFENAVYFLLGQQ